MKGFSKTYLLIAYLLPVSLLLWFINSFGVNVPYWDQWELVNFFDKMATGNATFADFWTQQNEHRLFFPKLIFLTLDFVFKWDTRIEMHFSVFLAIISSLAMYKIATISQNESRTLFHSFNIATYILTFSLVQYENWLWGFQLAWLLVNTCVIFAVFFLCVPKKMPPGQRLFLSAICCLVGSFSLAHGLLSWLAIIPTLAFLEGTVKQKRFRIFICIGLFALSLTIYLLGYQKPIHHPDITSSLKIPLITAKFFLSLLGLSIGKIIIPSFVTGFILLGFFVYFNVFIFKIDKSEFTKNAVPWLSIGWFGILCSSLTALGRASLGVEPSVASRYTTISTLLVISVLQMYRFMILQKREWFTKSSFLAVGSTFLVGIFTIIFIANTKDAIAQGRESWIQRTRGEACLELVNVNKSGSEQFDNCLKLLYPNPAIVRKRAETLERLGFRDFPNDIAFTTAPKENHGHLDIPATTDKPMIVQKNGSIQLAGWAILPERREQPKMVLLSYDNNQFFFADAVVKLDRPDVAKASNSSLYYKSGWKTSISPSFMPLGETVIKAWVYDPESKQFVKLIGEPKVKVVE